MHGQDSSDGREISLVLAAIFAFVVIGGVVDLILDQPDRLLSAHVIFEVLMIALSLTAAAYLARGWYLTRIRLDEERQESERLSRERTEWQDTASALLNGLGAAISRQFDAWALTPTERRVALMLLKGHSHKRIARLTETSERTVRQHSVAVYRKSGLAGRAGLAGFFLDSLMLPDDVVASESA
jgi:DNA-binding NarL/FixJ family response regulator